MKKRGRPNENVSYWRSASDDLRRESRRICRDNGCKIRADDGHKCGSYAYFDEDGHVADICLPDYAQRSYPAAVMLPWSGSGRDLKREVEDQLEESKGEMQS